MKSFYSLNPKFLAIACLALAIVGETVLREDDPVTLLEPILTFADNINIGLYLSLTAPVNILFGLFLLLLVMMVYGFLFRGQPDDHQRQYIDDGNWRPFQLKRMWAILALALYAFALWGIVARPPLIQPFWAWIISIAVFTLALWRAEPRGEDATNPRLNYVDAICVLALFALAIGIGAYRLTDIPAGWITDEGPFWETARRLALGEEKPSFFGVGVFTFPISSSYFQSWIMRWAGVNLWGWRFASVVAASLTVIPLYLLACELFNRHVAIVANAMMIVNPFFLAFARLGYNNSQAMLPVALAVYFLVLAIRRNSRFYLWLAGLSAGLGFYTYFAAWLGLVVLVITLSFLAILNRLNFRASLVPLSIVVAGILVVFLPRVVFGISADSTVALRYKIWETGPVNTFYGNMIFGNERIDQARVFVVDGVEMFYDPQLYMILLGRGFIRTSAVMFDSLGYGIHQIFFGLLGLGSSLFFILGMGLAFARFREIKYLIPMIWFLTGFFFLGVIASIPPRPTHMVAITPVFSLISAIGLTSLTNNLVRQSATRAHSLLAAVIIGVIAFMGLFHYYFMIPYFHAPANQDDYISWLGRQTSVPVNFILIDHIAESRNPTDEKLMDLTQHEVVSFSYADLQADPEEVKSWTNFVAYFAPANAEEHAEWLNSQIPGSTLQEAFAPGHRYRGVVVTDLATLNAEMDLNFARGISDLWNSPARAVLLVCATGILVIFSYGWRKSRAAAGS
ncbi:MAG TPA: glycosyltransferase family 39 protein [Anaerolineales bacterium]|nr:glycosyltransferase family 39 protein [Anaerolineales bacterium]